MAERSPLDALKAHHSDWRGTPYRYGGNGKEGIDCSAYMQRLFSDVFATALPRSTIEQIRNGRTVSRNSLRTGDLVFFLSGSKGRHVGVYLEDDLFLHASSSQGVTVSSLLGSYWERNYTTAKRVLE
ncbi:MAG: endopeptidase [Limnobacter sp.]|nr:endopeptidase [Limnobacter sp.]